MTVSISEFKKFELFSCYIKLVPLKMNLMRLARTFKTSNPQICRICKNDYLPGQIIFDRKENKISCIECDFESIYYTKIYPGEKSPNFYTPYPYDDKDDKDLLDRQDMSKNKRRPNKPELK
jgi:hypothetical protein